MSKNAPTTFVPLTTKELEKFNKLEKLGYRAHRTVTGSHTKYVVRKKLRRMPRP